MPKDYERVKKDLADLFGAYRTASKAVEELRDGDVLNSHDCDNILGHLKSGMIEDVLAYTRSHLVQTPEEGVIKTMGDYLAVKAALGRQSLKEEDAREILGIFFKK